MQTLSRAAGRRLPDSPECPVGGGRTGERDGEPDRAGRLLRTWELDPVGLRRGRDDLSLEGVADSDDADGLPVEAATAVAASTGKVVASTEEADGSFAAPFAD